MDSRSINILQVVSNANESEISTYGHYESGAAHVTSGGPLGGVGEGGDILVSSAFLSVRLGCKCR